jgi:Ca2+-binding RTX toxin-like protein
MVGGTGEDQMSGEDGNDILAGNGARDSLYGGNGDDTLTGGDQTDYLYGDAGTDTAIYSGNRADYTITFNSTLNGGTHYINDNRPGAPDGNDVVMSFLKCCWLIN